MRVADRVQKGAAVVVDDTLGVAGGARGVVERDRPPFVVGQRPFRRGVAFGEKGLVIGSAERLVSDGIVDFDERQRPAQLFAARP